MNRKKLPRIGVRAGYMALGMLLVLLVSLNNSSPAFGQSATGSISGQVVDPSGAIIPNVNVTLINLATDEHKSVTSNKDGYYSFLLVPPAHYTMTADSAGFQAFTQENIIVDVGLALKVNVALAVGRATEQIVVSDAPPAIETQTSSLGQVIDNQQINDLPTNGRNSYSFAALVPGVLAPSGFTRTAFDEYNDQAVSINGARPQQNVFLLDGGLNTEPAFNGPGYFPSIDLVQEYRVQTNNFSAEFSNAAGGVINVITKTGTNKFHGTAYEFYRGDSLTANDFFSNRYGLAKGVFTFNQFGGTLGGPILRKNTFFFANYEGFRQTNAAFFQTTVPTLLERQGNFSQTLSGTNGSPINIYNPFTTRPDPNNPGHFIRDPYTNNTITNINPVAQALLAYIPLPNTPGIGFNNVDNFVSKNPTGNVKDEGSGRIDHTFSPALRLFGRYSHSHAAEPYANLFGSSTPQLLTSTPNIVRDTFIQTQVTVDLTDVLTPTLLLELNTSFVRYTLTRTNPGDGFNPTQLGLPSYFTTLSVQNPPCFPYITIQGITNLGIPCQSLRDAYQDYYDYFNLKKEFAKHNISIGANVGMGTLGSARYLESGPQFAFDQSFTQGPDAGSGTPGQTTGSGFASLLAGTPASGSVSIGPNQILHYQWIGGYIQDDWKVTPSLTLNIGGRYDFYRPFVERFNRIADFNPTIASPLQVSGLNLVGGLQFPGSNGLPTTMFDPDTKDISPRIGFAYSPVNKTVIRGGYGLFYGPITSAGFNGTAVPNTGFSATTSEVTTLNNANPLTTLSDPFPQGFNQPTNNSLGLLTGFGQPIVGAPRNRKTPYTESYNLDLQQVFPGKFVFDIAYVGSHGVHLLSDRFANTLDSKYLSLTTHLFDQVPNPFYGIIKTGSLSGPTVNRRQVLLPYPQFTTVTIGGDTSFGASNYNALQLKLERRYTNGFSLLFAFTWSKLMDNTISSESGFQGSNFVEITPQDWYNLRANRTLSDFDIPKLTSISTSYDLPFGHGKAFLSGNRWANRFIGGWQINSIVTLQSGEPFTVVMAVDNIHNTGFTQLANWNGLPKTKSGPAKNRLTGYFNVAAFSDPGQYNFGNMPRVDGTLRAPGVFNTDLSGIKNVRLSDRFNAQFRAEAFNVFNHPQFGVPDIGLGDGNTGNVTFTVNTPRQIQLAGKFIF